TTSTPLPVLSSKADYHAAISHPGVTILQATAPWCAQCAAIAPAVQSMISDFPDVRFYTFDVEQAPDLAHELGVTFLPTFSVFKDGFIVEGVRGAKAEKLRKVI
ncbi:thioredoxin-like protein, partial [Aaosphaeria arxii CBS 175.79]